MLHHVLLTSPKYIPNLSTSHHLYYYHLIESTTLSLGPQQTSSKQLSILILIPDNPFSIQARVSFQNLRSSTIKTPYLD